ncbi:hypothetical protein [Rhodoferax sp.]|uniref:hypothetical protein n=1 Tax=Rhodoferax sp. TaxID=50421 RepID=UPI00262965AB|nr:hypothetical protein [Rhodoferax sp.]MDD2926436.1 hypothetical protein [Rhodoferax sp.]
MRFTTCFITLLSAIFLFACGGGGGSSGTSLGAGSVFSVAAPPALTLQAGLLQQYAIKGGVKPYSVFSTDPAVAVGWLAGEEVLAIGTVVPGRATVSAVDAKGSKVDIAVTSGSSTAFYMTAASAITITPGAAYAQTYILGGGTGPYTATSSFPSVATVSVNGNQMTITGVQISPTPANITIRDAAGATLTTVVTVGTVPLAVNPNNYTIFIGDHVRSIITGGTPPYRVQVGIDESLLNAQIVNGNEVDAVGGQVAVGAALTVIDANNQSVVMTVKISNGQDVLRVSPSVLSIPENANTPDLTLMVYGASAAGGIQVFTDDATILKPATPVRNADGSGYSVKLTGGNTCSLPVVVGPPATGGNRTVTITVLDAKGKIGTSTITVQDINGIAGCP